MSDKTFLDACLSGDAFVDEFEDYVGRWHRSDSAEPIWKYLGFREDEYGLIVERHEALKPVIHGRHSNIQLDEVVQGMAGQAIAARSADPAKSDKILEWLRRTGRI